MYYKLNDKIRITIRNIIIQYLSDNVQYNQ